MKRVFIDTSFLLGLVLTDDALHDRALSWQRAAKGSFLTMEYVLVEFVDALSSEPLRERAVSTIKLLQTDPAVELVPASPQIFEDGLRLFAQRPDKRWSLTDCISFTIMIRDSIHEALTADHHFEQAGFHALLKSPPLQA